MNRIGKIEKIVEKDNREKIEGLIEDNDNNKIIQEESKNPLNLITSKEGEIQREEK